MLFDKELLNCARQSCVLASQGIKIYSFTESPMGGIVVDWACNWHAHFKKLKKLREGGGGGHSLTYTGDFS